MAVHRYLRAVGFSNIEKREQLKELIGEVVTKTVLQETRPEMEQNIKEIGRYATKNFVADQEITYMQNFVLILQKMQVSV